VPASDRLFVEMSNADVKAIRIIDANGRQLFESYDVDVSASVPFTINIAPFSKGVYYLQVIQAEEVQVKKFIIR
jgi:hypothetical protein